MHDIYAEISIEGKAGELHENVFGKHLAYRRCKSKLIHFKDAKFNIQGLKYAEDGYEDCYEDNGRYLLVIGKAYRTIQDNPDRHTSDEIGAQNIFECLRKTPENICRLLKGNYAILSIDVSKRSCLIYRSPYSVFPLYYLTDGKKIIVSTFLSAIKSQVPSSMKLDAVALLESVLFNYPLGDRTFSERIKNLSDGEMIRVDENGLKNECLWGVKNILHYMNKEVSHNIDLGEDILGKNINRVMPGNRPALFLTAGLDSRLILSLLLSDSPMPVLCTFGKHGNDDIKIASQIARSKKYSHKAIYLDNDYYEKFFDYADNTLILSDGGTFERANYNYTFDKVSNDVDYIISGIGGSELLRTLQNTGSFVSSCAKDIFNLNFNEKKIRNVIHAHIKNYFPVMRINVNHIVDEIIKDLRSTLLNKYCVRYQNMYLFQIKECFIKYFGAQLQSEKIYGGHNTPFWDYDFINYSLSYKGSGTKTRPFNPSIFERIQSQYYYAHILKSRDSELLEFATSHGYSPKYLLQKGGLFKIAVQQLAHKVSHFSNKSQGFDAERLCGAYIKGCLKTGRFKKDPELMNNIIAKKIKTDSRYAYFRLISIMSWLAYNKESFEELLQ